MPISQMTKLKINNFLEVSQDPKQSSFPFLCLLQSLFPCRHHFYMGAMEVFSTATPLLKDTLSFADGFMYMKM